ncbi:hypothetical protein QBC41DRAFT_395855 [Cercophora samala]|uniref:Uncharacterized protein n=1 Tax=Cercophora samala TaxID=330535 RepID=A0AA39ZAX8_9PEZI|nr:hypothetical protein QBC41DRAFT_395855 [Cercophora samala]
MTPETRWEFELGKNLGSAFEFDYRPRCAPDSSKSIQAMYETDHIWTPVAELIRRLSGLTDVVFQCPSQFPPCLLRVVHDHKKITRLHLRTWFLRSLNYDSWVVEDPHELALIRSPTLYSIWLCPERRRPRDPNSIYHQSEAVSQMLTTKGLAPNLRELRRCQSKDLAPQQYAFFFRAEESDKKPLEKGTRVLALRNLQLVGRFSKRNGVGYGEPFDNRQLANWQARINFSTLESLALSMHLHRSALRNLSALAFPALTNDDNVLGSPNHTLKMLRLAPIVDQYGLHRINGSLVQRKQQLTEEQILELGKRYPFVEDLSISVKRSMGDADEVGRYKAIGRSFRKLKILFLDLDASPSSPLVYRFGRSNAHIALPTAATHFQDNFGRQPAPGELRHYYTNAHIMEAMVNAALGSDLAKAIFDTIFQANWEGVPERAPPHFRLGDWGRALQRAYVVDNRGLRGTRVRNWPDGEYH